MAFKPRTTCPDKNDKCWITTGYGGYNKCIVGKPAYSTGSAIANCVGYAWGRFLEIMRQSDPSITTCELPTCNAGDFIKYNTKYDVGQEAQLGAIAVFAPNHVAIVEAIDSNGVCTLSESGWGGPTFKYGNTISKANKYNDHSWGGYTLKGFIYNPYGGKGVCAADVFVEEAAKHIGEKAGWTWLTYGTSNIEWCAAFVSSVASVVGLTGKCIAKSASASGIVRESVKANMGTFHKGPSQGGTYRPVKGDLIQFRHSNTTITDEYSAGHVGIVAEVVEQNIYTIEGNTGTNNKNTSTVQRKAYTVATQKISGYFHPNWSLVGSIEPGSEGFVTGELYDTATTKRDMTVREIGYLDSQFKPSIKSSSIKLSVINYTGVLAAAFRLVAPTVTGTTSVNTDGLEGNCKIVVDYLIGKGLNAAAACGVAGNIQHESSFRTDAVGDHGTSFGICQWHNERGTAMKQVAGSNWRTNLSGQLDYLWQELNQAYYKNSVLVPLQAVPNTEAGCRNAADVFVRKFEVPSDVDVKSLLRQATAVEYFNKVVVIATSPTVPGIDDSNLKTQSGQPATIVRTIEVPSSVKQTGIIRNYTNYSQFFGRWSKGTVQRKLSEIWGSQNKPQSRNIATINGYYLVAMSSKFATTGDIVTIELANGDKIHAILGDAKGADATNPWGHVLGGGVDIIEWEAIGNGQQGSTKIDLGSWAGQKVVRVHNRGPFLR